MLENSTSLRGKNVSKEIKMKLAATRNVIMNKFNEAHANRIANEKNLNHAMQSLVVESTDDATIQSNAKQSQFMSTIKVVVDNPNKLCERLKILLKMNTNDEKLVQEMKTIIKKLRELEILE